MRQRFYEMLRRNVKLGKRTWSEFRTDQLSPTYNIHVLVSADGQRLVLRAKLLYDPVYLRVPVVDDGKITPWNKQAYQEVCDAIQHASVWILTSMDWRSVRRSCHVWPRELALKWIDAPALECGHAIERKDSAHDRSEQVLCNRLQRFLRRFLSVRATLLNLPQSLRRSSMLRCRVFAGAAQRYVCWKRLMPGTAFIGRWTLTLVRRDLWSYCYFWNWQTSWWRRLFCIDITACYFVLFCQVPTSSRRCCRFWTECSKQWSQQ